MTTTGSHGPRCLVCGARNAQPWAEAWDAEYRTCDDRFRYLRCRGCGVLFIDPVPVERLAEIYPANYYSFVSEHRSLAFRVKDWLDARFFREMLRAIPGNSLRVLDVGGGGGWQLDAVRRADPRVSFTKVVDMDPGAEALARERGHDYFCGRIEDFESDERFDLVILLNLIEHVADPPAVLRKTAQLLTPQGRALIKTPNIDSLDARVFRRHNWAGYHCPRHWALFDRASFESTAREAKLRVVEFRYTQGAAFWALSVLFWLAERGWVSITRERPALTHRLFPPLVAGFAAFDTARALLGGKRSQMFFVLGPDGA